MGVDGVPADRWRLLRGHHVRPAVYDVAVPGVLVVPGCHGRVDRGDRDPELGYQVAVVEWHPIVACHEHERRCIGPRSNKCVNQRVVERPVKLEL